MPLYEAITFCARNNLRPTKNVQNKGDIDTIKLSELGSKELPSEDSSKFATKQSFISQTEGTNRQTEGPKKEEANTEGSCEKWPQI